MRALLRAYEWLIVALAVLGGAILLGATVLIIVDVVARNTALPPVRAASALVEYAMLAATAFGAPWLVRRGGHVAIDSFVVRLPAGARFMVSRATLALPLAIAAFLAWRAGVIAVEAAMRGAVDIRSIDLPGWLAPALLALALGLCATEFLRLLVLRRELPRSAHGSGA
ncbi:TRAP transporter small permease [Acuticoccus kandeliae]|uniref:TRAP transporter small permease n=1 Tax=Acuticoccus kandeliae TaxID=2073160 RepID=UPI000D3E1D2E|nr:TRAP transporter small permease subunit [Acuticoccus kandeliae]